MASFENRCISDEDVTSVLWLVRSFSHSLRRRLRLYVETIRKRRNRHPKKKETF